MPHPPPSAATATTATTTTTTTAPLRLYSPLHNVQFAHGYTHPYYSAAPAPAMMPSRPSSQGSPIRVSRHQRQRSTDINVLVSKAIPGLKTSAAFFASLRMNLHLHATPPSLASPMSTPNSLRPSPAPSSLPSAFAPSMDLSMAEESALYLSIPDIDSPKVETHLATTPDEKVAALALVAASTAQMRDIANATLLQHPLNLALTFVIILTLLIRESTRHWFTLTGVVFLVLAALCASRYITRGYLDAAEDVMKHDSHWLHDADDVLVTTLGDQVIGTAVLEWTPADNTGGRPKRRKAWSGRIKAWTIREEHRGQGRGTALLEDVVKHARRRSCVESVEFAGNHANSKRVLPNFYNGPFEERDRKARELLRDLLEISPCRGNKKR